ncbi:class I SAM-dependent methyltransferase [Chryseolinea lacunae]|uniref:Class I SAM-dependent methyltransferase n=1 Tax=Chryseolinea lacunae TaxID=2801331 RepID=A0ABS1KQK7_9BACT|nr:class I SAM-dependent methyltransferase [Chryseolinea lacunae]MBL0741768.1 class I SAM-dependent methyltransferase [Chryseolinea lacunae]
MKELKSCPVCHSSVFTPFLNCKDYTVSHETFQLVTCKTCSFTFTNPVPDPERLGDYYLSDTYISHSNKAKGLIDSVYILARTFTLKWKVKLITNHSLGKGRQLLDYGCGTGDFLKAAKEQQWAVAGVEPSALARSQAEQSTQEKIATALPELTGKKFDVITLWHVLEHIDDLNECIQSLKQQLNDDGTLLIAVPNYECWDGKHYQSHWAGYDVPRHLWHFSRKTMDLLMTNNGLKIKNIVPMKLDAFYISLLSEKYKTGTSGLGGMLKAVWNGIKSNSKAAKTNDYSSLIYIIRK